MKGYRFDRYRRGTCHSGGPGPAHAVVDGSTPRRVRGLGLGSCARTPMGNGRRPATARRVSVGLERAFRAGLRDALVGRSKQSDRRLRRSAAVPHARGDEPIIDLHVSVFKEVFPTHVGMNRLDALGGLV